MAKEYEFDVTMLVTAEDEHDAYSQISDAGLSSGAMIGTLLVISVDTLDDGVEARRG